MAPKKAMAQAPMKAVSKRASSKAKAKAKAKSKAKANGKGRAKPTPEVADTEELPDTEATAETAEAVDVEELTPAALQKFTRNVLGRSGLNESDAAVQEMAKQIKALPSGAGKMALYRDLVQAYNAGGAKAALKKMQQKEVVRQMKLCSEKTVAVPMALMVGQCGGNVALFQQALQSGDIVEVKDPKRPGATLYKWTAYETSQSSGLERVAQLTGDAADVEAGIFDALDLEFNFEKTGNTAATVLPLTAAAPAAAPSQLALVDASAEQKLWLKLTEAHRVGTGIAFKAQLAVSGLGKSTVAKASGAALNTLIADVKQNLDKFGHWAMRHSAGETVGLPDAATLTQELKTFHVALAELSKGEKSALALKDKAVKGATSGE